MSETFEQSIVSHLEEHVELAISTVQQLRTEKLELEAEVARLNSDVLQRDTKIQELETRNSDLEEELNLERLGTSQERSEIKERLEGLMNVLATSSETTEAEASGEITFETAEAETSGEITFETQDDASNEGTASSVTDSEQSE